MPATANILCHGDNLEAMDALSKGGRVFDLVYIDPPFATNNVFRTDPSRSAAMSAPSDGRLAYDDRYELDDYIGFMEPRVAAGRDLLAEHGSFYIHTDAKVGHHVKVLMDRVFGAGAFRNEITRIKCNPKNFRRRSYGNIKDTILFYTKGDDYIWNAPRTPWTESDLLEAYPKTDDRGRRYATVALHAPGESHGKHTGHSWRDVRPPRGRHWSIPFEEMDALDEKGLIEWSANGVPRRIIYGSDAERSGRAMQDVWTFKDPQSPLYPTQKNREMLDVIVRASSSPGGAVLDFFCGSGTSLVAADGAGRSWAGIDASQAAVDVARRRLGEIGAVWQDDVLVSSVDSTVTSTEEVMP